MFCIRKAVSDIIPKRKCADSHFNVPGWNAYVRDKHDLAREAYLVWVYDGKPKHGLHFETMKRTRAIFKLAVRYCKIHIEQMNIEQV